MTSSYVIFIFRFYNVLLETAGSILKSASHIWVMVISWYLVHFLIEITVFFKPVSEIYAKFTYETRFCFWICVIFHFWFGGLKWAFTLFCFSQMRDILI